MVTALILSGGTGTRLGGSIPKQYLLVNNKPIIGYCMDTFQANSTITNIVIVADCSWWNMLQEYIHDYDISKFVGFANAGQSRQHSILNGLRCIRDLGGKPEDLVVIHDAARPCVSTEIINQCISLLEDFDCSMPVISVKDTVYVSEDGKNINSLLNRDYLFAGQAPEGCHLGTYLAINEALTDEELEQIRGTCAIAYDKGLKVGLFPGSEKNYKITTKDDYNKFVMEMRKSL
ncbi:MAG: 2-C-methyl-D-erythritol 4-phosphate cytidylyltransferase [Acidaminococcaceae bacterium]|nr:2-C-methyl-D-erythritol 4-phosphate cytidylyltransferase [Acidaminococcaceae bacterium]